MLENEIESIEAALAKFSPSDIAAFSNMDRSGAIPGLTIENNVATIAISGPMMQHRSPVLDFLGKEHTAYSDIIANIETAKSKGVEGIVFAMDSPGGAVTGMNTTMDAMAAISVPTVTDIRGTAASAAYIMGTQTDKIVASNELNMVGSVGVMIPVSNDGATSISNPESPDKAPDLGTPEGKAVIQKTLSDIYSIVVEKIASGRGTTVENINANYGKGAVMTARTALKSGMIDAIGTQETAASTSGAQTDTGVKVMDKTKLKAEHPALYAAILSEGAEAGKSQALEIVEGHLTLADASGDSERALEDIKGMKPVTASVMAHHTAAGIRKAGIDARGGEAPPVPGNPPAGSTPGDESFAKEQSDLNAMVDGVDVEF